MNVIVSMETDQSKKIKLGEFESPYYASLLAESVLKSKLDNKEYVKISIELAEEEKWIEIKSQKQC